MLKLRKVARFSSYLPSLLTALVFWIPSPSVHASCSVHDHSCVFHGFQSDVHTDAPMSSTTQAVFYTIGSAPDSGGSTPSVTLPKNSSTDN